MKKTLIFLVKIMTILGLGFILSNCGTMVNGRYQTIHITTNSPGAKCHLYNTKGKWHVKTPGKVKIRRDKAALFIKCSNHKVMQIKPKLSRASALGNVLMPGTVITTNVDVSNGSAFKYPENIVVK